MTKEYVVARMHEGDPFDYVHSLNAQTWRATICMDIREARRFTSEIEAWDAAGAAMHEDPHGSNYSVVPAPTNPKGEAE